ncbi:SurA N-terminal domain-containing protein [Candidatus Dojkabacteria bacterium]|nr:SurA N-terminal domain-containing protein [Candidatus Dojkabacteria bacterium]
MPRTKSKASSTSKKVAKKAEKIVNELKGTTPVVTSLPKGKLQVKLDKKKVVKVLLYTLLFVLSFALIDLFVQYLNNGYSVAVVNGQRVTKSEYYDRLSKGYGLQATSALIDETLIEQEGEAKDITVTQKDVDDRVKEISDQLGGDKVLEETLKANNITREDIERQIRLEIITTRILEPSLKYEDKDVEAFFNQYKSVLYQDEDVKFADKKVEVTNSFISQKVEEAKTAWLEGLRGKAKIQNNISTEPTYGAFKTITNIINNMLKEIKNK